MRKINLFKRGLSMFTAATLMAGVLVCGTAVQKPTVAEAATTKNIAAPVYSAVMDFEGVTSGTYTKAGTGEGVIGNTITDGGLSFSVGEAAVTDATVTVMQDAQNKINGSTVLKVNPFSTTTASKRYAMLRPTDLTVPGGTDKTFSTKDESGTRLSRGYRLHYSYDYYVDGITAGFTTQDLRWMNGTSQVTSETLLNAKTTHLHNPNTAKVASGDGEKDDSAKKGTLNWTGSKWTQSSYPKAIHMDYIIDLETGEIWMYSDGKLFACRDFSESPRSYYATAYQSLQNINNLMIQLRMKTASDETGVVYYDNFKVDMYGSDVSAKQLRELVSESASGHKDSAVTHQATANFDSTVINGTNISFTNTNVNSVIENGKLKVVRKNASTGDAYLVMKPGLYNTYAALTEHSVDLPEKPDGANKPTDAGIRYLRLGYDRAGGKDEDGNLQYALYGAEYTDYMSLSFDVTPGASNTGRIRFDAYYYQFDGRSTKGATLPGGAAVQIYSVVFVDFNHNANKLRALGSDTGLTWEAGKEYHVDYLVNPQDNTEIVFVDGKEVGRKKTADINKRGALAFFRTFMYGKTDVCYLDNVTLNIYNQLNTSFEALENEMAYAATIENLSTNLASDTVTVTATIGGSIAKYPGAKIITALYQNYGEANARMLSAAIKDYKGVENFTANLPADGETENLKVKVFIWTMEGLIPVNLAESQVGVN